MKSKILYLIIICNLFFYTAIFAQAQTNYANSEPVSLSIVSDNCPINKIPVSVYVRPYVEEKINEWQKKGEFEKTVDYEIRVNEKTRNEQANIYTAKTLEKMKNEYTSFINWDDLTLSIYDANNETFLIVTEELENFAIPVPTADAPYFKENFKKMNYKNQDYYVVNDKLVLAKLEFISPDSKVFKYDANVSTTYSADNITFVFTPLVINVNEDEVENNTNIENNTITVGLSKVDMNIPVTNTQKNNTYALIIGNENYAEHQTELTSTSNVEFAINDAKMFKEYLVKTIGVPETNIIELYDGQRYQMVRDINRLIELSEIEGEDCELIFYFAGHGFPDEATKDAYIMPVEVSGADVKNGIKLADLYQDLTKYPTKRVTVFLDACFSGGGRNEGLVPARSGIRISTNENKLTGNFIVFAASSGEQISLPYRAEGHGMFTYFLLKALQESKGNITYGQLADKIIKNVQTTSITVNKIKQDPKVNTSEKVIDTWENFMLK